jgi:hypothetical protein
MRKEENSVSGSRLGSYSGKGTKVTFARGLLLCITIAIGAPSHAQLGCVDQCEATCSFQSPVTIGDKVAHTQWNTCFDSCLAGPACADQKAAHAEPRANQDRTPSTHSPRETESPGPTCFRNSYYGMNLTGDSASFWIVCLDPNKSVHWNNGPNPHASNGDGLATAGPAEFRMLLRNCMTTPVEYSCPECCQPH